MAPEGALEIPEGPRIWRLSMRDGVGLHVEEWGSRQSEAPPLLCLSGLTRNAWDFEALARRQSAKRRVVALDFRGRGRSDFAADAGSYNPRQYLDDIAQVCAALALHDFVAVGTSMGGLLTFGLGAVMPSALRAAVINDIGPSYEPGGVARILDYVGNDRAVADWRGAAKVIQESYPEGCYPRADAQTWAKIAKTSFKRAGDGRLHVSWDTRIAEGLARQDNGSLDLWALFGTLRHRPLLLVRGETSDLLSAATAQKMAEQHSEMSLVTVAGTPHAPSLDEPECVKALDDFLDELD